MQLALYREMVYHKYGFRPHPYIAAMEKKAVPNFEVFNMAADKISFEALRGELARAIEAMDAMSEIVDKDPSEVKKCGNCQWCLSQKKLTEAVPFKYDPKILRF